MSKYTHILIWVPLMYIVLFFTLWVRIYQNDIISFEQYVLNKQVNYASESAMDELLASGHLNQDYSDGDFQTYEPDIAVKDYAATLAMNSGNPPTESYIEYVRNNKIRTLAVCVQDGIYFYYPQKTETHTVSLAQSPKVPYFYTNEEGRQFCLTLNPDKGYWDNGTTTSNYSIHDYDFYPASIRPSNDVQATSINNQVADILNWALYQTYASKKSGRETHVELPAIANTVRGEQPINAPTILAVVDGSSKVFSTYLTAQSIGGAQLEETDHIVGYTVSGAVINGVTFNGKFYANASWWAAHPELESNLSNGHYYDSVYEAASAGYANLNLL